MDYSSSKITLIQYGTMVINLWFKEHNIAWCAVRHNIAWCAVRHNISWFERSSLTVKTWHLAVLRTVKWNLEWFMKIPYGQVYTL